jgi:hypothetical protein
VEVLRAAIQEGYRDGTALATEPDLEPLRQNDDFQKLLKELEAKTAAQTKPAPPRPEK